MESNLSSHRTNDRLYSLDLLRGLAAISVVIFHWNHFAIQPWLQGGKGIAVTDYPLYTVLGPFYLEGSRAVDLFFCISGFIFYWLYATPVAEKRISAGRFALFRFSRLYPLHLATLLVVALLQGFVWSKHGLYFIYQANDFYHFILSLFMLSGWGLGSSFSFNGPSWSVSVEVLVYFIFFGLCRMGWQRPWQLACLACFGLLLEEFWMPINGERNMIGEGISGFFIGGLTYALAKRLFADNTPRPATRYTLIITTVAAWWFAPALSADYGYSVLAYPLTMLSLVAIERGVNLSFKRVAWLGDISYSVYLWHVPLMIFVYLLIPMLGLEQDFFLSPTALFAYFGLLGLVGWISCYHFERPVERILRKRFDAAGVG